MAEKEKHMEAARRQSEAGQEQTVEELFVSLETLMAGMEEEGTSLEDSFALYHKGMDMLKALNDKIDRIEKKMLVLDEEGESHEF